MADQFVLEIDWARPELPRLVGPFQIRGEAERWARLNIWNGEWSIATLAYPYSDLRLEPPHD